MQGLAYKRKGEQMSNRNDSISCRRMLAEVCAGSAARCHVSQPPILEDMLIVRAQIKSSYAPSVRLQIFRFPQNVGEELFGPLQNA